MSTRSCPTYSARRRTTAANRTITTFTSVTSSYRPTPYLISSFTALFGSSFDRDWVLSAAVEGRRTTEGAPLRSTRPGAVRASRFTGNNQTGLRSYPTASQSRNRSRVSLASKTELRNRCNDNNNWRGRRSGQEVRDRETLFCCRLR